MSKISSSEALSKIIELLHPLEEGERTRVVRAVRTFFGEASEDGGPEKGARDRAAASGNVLDRQPPRGPTGGAKAYFDQKQPKSKIEELAVAARFREEAESADSSTLEELRVVFGNARRTFDAHNFRRDLDNARTKGLFMRGTGRNSVQLSSYGQSLIDTLPNREKVKDIARPKKSRKTGKKTA